MSYDIWLEYPNGDPAAKALETFAWFDDHSHRAPTPTTNEVYEVGNYTSNVSSMWHKALGCSLADLGGQPAGGQVELIAAALVAMEAHPDEYRTMEPPNGWGSYEGAHDYLLRLLLACLRHPEATIRVSH